MYLTDFPRQTRRWRWKVRGKPRHGVSKVLPGCYKEVEFKKARSFARNYLSYAFLLVMSQETYSLRSGSAEKEADRYVSRRR